MLHVVSNCMNVQHTTPVVSGTSNFTRKPGQLMWPAIPCYCHDIPHAVLVYTIGDGHLTFSLVSVSSLDASPLHSQACWLLLTGSVHLPCWTEVL